LPCIVIDRNVPLNRHRIATEQRPLSLDEERYRTGRMTGRMVYPDLIFFRSVRIDNIAFCQLMVQLDRTPDKD
jgi:hypothetical protein